MLDSWQGERSMEPSPRDKGGESMRTCPLLIVALSVLSPAVSLADLDVAIPPGTPLEWRFELPFHVPEGDRGPIYTHSRSERPEPKEDDSAPRGRTVVVTRSDKTTPPPPPPRFGSFNPMGAARILTMDILGHLPWTQWKGGDEAPAETGYPPQTRADLYWLTLTAFLRGMLHPARISRAETANYLILIGPAIHDSMRGGQGLGAMQEIIGYLEANVPKVPPAPPASGAVLDGVRDPEQKMLIRWASREIVADHPHAYNPLYARRTISLGAEAVPVLLACCQSDHPVLQENAVGLLGAFDTYDEKVIETLRRAARGRDAVSRNRAIESLVRWNDPELESFLIQALRGKDRIFLVYAVQALGRMGSVKARPLIQRLLSVDPGDKGETWMAAVTALSRIPDSAEKTIRVLEKAARVWSMHPQGLEVGPGGGADIPDPPGCRADLLVEAARIAMARLGHNGSREELLDRVERGAGGGGAGPVGPGGARFVRRVRDPVLGDIEAYNQLAAIEALAEMEQDGRSRLRDIVTSSTDIILRGYALSQLVRVGRDDDFVKEVATNSAYPSVLRVHAVEALARSEGTRADALDVARSMIQGYLAGGNIGPAGGARRINVSAGDDLPPYECLSALKLLGEHDPPEPATIIRVLETAKERGDYERLEGPQKAEAGPGRGPRGPGQVNETTLRAFPAVFETAVVELGRLGDKESARYLGKILTDSDSPGRVEAALGLGNVRVVAAVELLIRALEDEEPWVRYAAYRSLRTISGEDYFSDWLFGSKSERRRAVAQWKEWLASKV